jgi:hypothetical protein
MRTLYPRNSSTVEAATRMQTDPWARGREVSEINACSNRLELHRLELRMEPHFHSSIWLASISRPILCAHHCFPIASQFARAGCKPPPVCLAMVTPRRARRV